MDKRDGRKLARRTVLGATGLGILGAVSGSAAGQEDDEGSEGHGSDFEDIIAEWDETPQEVAETTMNQYGEPDESVPSRLIWHHDDDAPWKRTELFRDTVPHHFPMEHPGLLEQFIDYHVPPELYDCIARYDGSVMLERTKGEVSAQCDKEEMNFLAVNLTHELVTTDMGIDEARRAYAEDAIAFNMEDGGTAPHTGPPVRVAGWRSARSRHRGHPGRRDRHGHRYGHGVDDRT